MDNSKLASLRQKMSGIKVGGTGFFKAQPGPNTIRILPGKNEDGIFFAEIGKHYAPDEKKSWVCPNFTLTRGDRCPICELVRDLYRSKDPGDKQLAEAMRLKKQFNMWIVDRANPSAGPQIFAAGATVFGVIMSLVHDTEYGDITDPEAGYDIIVDRKGEGKNTEYSTRAKKNPSPLSNDPDQADEWWERIDDVVAAAEGTLQSTEDLEASLAEYLKLAPPDAEPEVEARPAARPAPAATPAPAAPSGLRRGIMRRS